MTARTKRFSINTVGDVMTSVVKHVEAQAAKVDTALYGRENARQRMPLPEEYGSDRSIGDLPRIAPQMPRLARGVFTTYMLYKRRQKPSKSVVTPAFLHQLEAYARENGALAIGYAKITPDLIFRDFAIPHDNAIVIISEMEKETFSTAPSVDAMVEVAKAYADTTLIATKLSRYLRKHGFSAYSGISIGGSVDHTRLAEKAALGKIGYHGSLISPQAGARVRINVVYTNIGNLPFPAENEYDWVLDFCEMCKRCIRKCPAEAIRENPPPDADGRISAIDAAKCGPYMAANHGCGVCIAVCPFSMAGYQKVEDGFRKKRNRQLADQVGHKS